MSKQLRIATLGKFNNWFSWFLETTIQGSILNGAWFRPIDIDQRTSRIKEQIDYFKPNILFTHAIFSENFSIPNTNEKTTMEEMHETIALMRKKWNIFVVYQEGDPKNKPRYNNDIQHLVDAVLLNSKMPFSEIWKVPVYHWPYCGLIQKEIVDEDNLYKSRLSFSGNVSESRKITHPHYKRKKFLDKVARRIELKIYPNVAIGNSRFVTPEVSSSSGGVIGIHQGFSVDSYLDTRPWQYIGSGALYFHDKCDAIEQFFEDGVHYVSYKRHEVEDLYNKYMEYQGEKGYKIRQQGFKYVQRYHTPLQRVKFVIDLYEGKDAKQLLYLKDIKEKYGKKYMNK